ncbi:MAG: DUF4190 domain-containing protein [Neisseria sp.]|nr:DUF4190 domain-containing protein [Neisseria sp.]
MKSSVREQNVLAPISLAFGLSAYCLLLVTLLLFSAAGVLATLCALAAILLGHIAYAKTKRLDVGGKKAALAALVLGYSGFVAVLVLLGMLMALPKGKDLSVLIEEPSKPVIAAVQAQPEEVGENREPGSLPPAAKSVLAVQHDVEMRIKNGSSLNEINEDYPLSDEDRRYWKSIEIRQGSIVLTQLPDTMGMSQQIMLLSAVEDGKLSWACAGKLDKDMERAICR